MRSFKKQYESQMKKASQQNRSPKEVLVNKLRGRLCLLGNQCTLVQKYLKVTRYRGGIVNITVALAKAKALVERYPLLEKDKIVIGKPWAQTFSGA